MSGDGYSLAELMCIEAARLMPDEGVAVLGLGLPVLAGALAKCLHHPDLVVCTEVGAIDWRPDPSAVARAPIGIHDLVLNDGAAMTTDMVDVLAALLMGGRVDMGTLTAAQIDRYGNLNTLVIGDYASPERRLAGTGGNTDVACLARRVLVLIPQEPRRWVERADFITRPGYIDGPGGRRRAGLGPQGPNLVVSTMGVYGFDTPDGGETGSCQLVLEAVFPGFEPETVQALVPWPLQVAPEVREVEPPTAEELRTLRRLDPFRHYLAPGRY